MPYAPISGAPFLVIGLGVVIRSVVAPPASFPPKSRYSARNVLQGAIIRTGLGTLPVTLGTIWSGSEPQFAVRRQSRLKIRDFFPSLVREDGPLLAVAGIAAIAVFAKLK